MNIRWWIFSAMLAFAAFQYDLCSLCRLREGQAGVPRYRVRDLARVGAEVVVRW
jgi:hypothetical protein